MAIPGGGISRVSHGLQTFTLLTRLRDNSLRLFQEQQRLASGKQLLSVSDDPIAATKIARLNQARQGQDQILTNLRHADKQLTAADAAVSDVADLLIQASRIASEQAGSLQSTDERASQAVVLDGIITQLQNLGNQQFEGLYLFGGRSVENSPLSSTLGRVTHVGDLGRRSTIVDTGFSQPFDVNVAEVFNLNENVTGGIANFNVQLAADTRISDISGVLNAGVRLGPIRVTQGGPPVTFDVDFTGADTVADLIARFNQAAANAGSSLTLGTNPTDASRLYIASAPGVTINVSDVGNGTTAADLGIRKSVGAGVDLVGDDVQPKATLTTRLTDLAVGGISLPSGIRITNGSLSATVTFAGATTVQDVLNTLNASNVGIRASINAAGDGIEIRNLIAGTPLVIGENGGVDAATLGIKTLNTGSSLSSLNGLRGLHPVTGADFRITDANGIAFDVDVTGAKTVGDIINAINSAAALAGTTVTATVSNAGAGIALSGPAGAGNLTVEKLNLSPVADELGILKTGSATLLEGDNVAQSYQSGIFSALYRLRDALVSDNSSEITEAGSQINAVQRHVSSVAGQVGAASKAMRARLEQTENAVTATEVLLSDLEEVDFTEAVTRFQQAQTALQASLLAGSQTQNLSLLDFLR